ncbi:MAG TPA: ATP-binding cassette domain-containing protein [Aliiroseovarius sp.]|nr:ATP-binding cassette domain-containing protein [Aliiroseovarius sp.]
MVSARTTQDAPDILPLKLSGAVARARGKTLVGPVDLTLGTTGLTMVIGPNGAGKTTLLRLMHGLERCREGRIDWAVARDVARRRQAFVFQAPIMMRRRVLDSLAYPLHLTGMPRTEARARASEIAGRFGLGALLDNWAPLLSGGEKQKLALARALIIDPQVLFLDEPCANLDGRAMREFEALLAREARAGRRIIMSSHDMGQVRRLAGDVVFLVGGRICEHAPAERFFAAPETPQARAFLNGDIVE